MIVRWNPFYPFLSANLPLLATPAQLFLPQKRGKGKVVGISTHTLSLSLSSVLREHVVNERVNERGCSLAGRLAGSALPEQEAGARKILSYVFIPALLIIEMHPS